MKLVRLSLIGLASLVMLTAIALAAAFWVLATEAGSAWAIAQLQARTQAPVQIGDLRGTLWRGLDARDVTLDLAPDRARISRVLLSLDLSSLAAGAVALTRLEIEDVDFERDVISGAAVAGTDISIPLRVIVREGSVREFAITIGGEPRVIGPATFSLIAEGARVVAEDVSAQVIGFDVNGRGELSLGSGLGVAADFAWDTQQDELAAAGSGRIEGTWPVLDVRQTLTAPAPILVAGTLRLGSAPHAELGLQWSDLAWPGLVIAQSPAGSMQVSGWLEEFAFDGDGTLVVDGITMQFDAVGDGTPAAVAFSQLTLSSAHGDVRGTGRLALEPLSWDFDVEADGLDPAVRFADWPGSLTIAGRLSGRRAPALAVALRDLRAAGELRQQTVTATGSVAYSAPNQWELGNLRLDLSGNRIEVDGTIGAALALDVGVYAEELERVLPAAAGALDITGRIAGTLEEPELNGSLEARNLRYGDYAVDALVVSGDIVSDDTRAVSLTLAGKSVRWRDVTIDAVDGVVVGSVAQHLADLDVDSAYGTAHLLAEGGWSQERWQGVLTALEVAEPALGDWQLTAPAELTLGADGAALGRACLAQGEARMCTAARIGTAADSIELELTAFDIAVLEPWMGGAVAATGVYDAEVSLAGPLLQPAGTISVRSDRTALTIRDADAAPLEMPIENVVLEAAISPAGTLDLRGELSGENDAQFGVTATIAGLWTEEPTVSAEVAGFWGDLSLLSLVSPDVGEVTGVANIDLEISGRLRAPDIRGSARWSEGQLAVPRWGFLVDGIEAEAMSPDGAQLTIRASGRVGDGRIEVDGETRIDPAANWPTELRVQGEGLQAVRIPEADIVVSPDLRVRAALPNVDVDGTFLIPYGRIRLDVLPPQAVEASPDTIVHGVDAVDARERPISMSANVRVEVGSDVRYAGQGLDVALSGDMRLAYESGRDATASGALNLSGEYSAYGQSLQIDQGRLLFTGPLDNPTLDVRAIRRIEDITAGVQLGGSVNAPVTRVFSEPAMSEADALSYLLFGRSLSNSEAQETATLESAAVSMGLRQALPIIQRVGETLGLDEFSVQTTSADSGELMAGKQISPRLYIRYSYGLFNRIGGLLMRFNLSERLSLETRSGDNRAMDLIYTVERE